MTKSSCNPKSRNFLKIGFKIGGVGLKFFSKSATNLFAQNIIEWAEKWFATEKVDIFGNFSENLGVLDLETFQNQKNNLLLQAL